MTESTESVEKKCPRCGALHGLIECPGVKAMEFEDGDLRLVRRVEFLTPTDCGIRVAADPGGPQENYPKLGPRKA